MRAGGIGPLCPASNSTMTQNGQMDPSERLVAGFVGAMVGFFAFSYGQPAQKVIIGGFAVVILTVAILGRNPLAGGAKE